MSGIAGFWNLDGRDADPAILTAMLARLRHRGPDDEGRWLEGPIALGHRRLGVRGLSPASAGSGAAAFPGLRTTASEGRQPVAIGDGEAVLCQSGEIFNHLELRCDLEKEGCRFHSRSDIEVVLHALHRWGPVQAAPRFNGMFALAFHDRRARALYLIRDRLGIVPLYFYRSPDFIAFGSEIKAVLSHPAVPAEPDLRAVTILAYHERLDGPETPFREVEAVLPGSILRVTPERTESITWFDLLRDLDVARIARGQAFFPKTDRSARAGSRPGPGADRFDAAAGHLEELLGASVDLHLRGGAPLAAMCSGGIDSSLLTALARERRPDLVAYVADIEGVGGEEHRRASLVCRHLGVELRPVSVTWDACLRLWPMAVLHNDQPLYFANDIACALLARTAREDGFQGLLSGEGADELFGGYRWHASAHATWRRRRWHARLWPDVPPLRTLGRLGRRLAPLDLPLLARQPFRHVDDDLAARREIRAALLLDGGRRYLRQAALFQRLADLPRLEDRAFLARCFDDVYIHLGSLLPSRNKMFLAASVELRVPYLETALIDFGLHLPPDYKFDGRRGKRLSRLLIRRRLPAAISHAPKIGFELPQAMWNRTAGLLDDGMVREYFRWGASEMAAVHEHLRRDPYFVFTLVGLEIWARLFFGGASPEDLGETLARVAAAASAGSAGPSD